MLFMVCKTFADIAISFEIATLALKFIFEGHSLCEVIVLNRDSLVIDELSPVNGLVLILSIFINFFFLFELLFDTTSHPIGLKIVVVFEIESARILAPARSDRLIRQPFFGNVHKIIASALFFCCLYAFIHRVKSTKVPLTMVEIDGVHPVAETSDLVRSLIIIN